MTHVLCAQRQILDNYSIIVCSQFNRLDKPIPSLLMYVNSIPMKTFMTTHIIRLIVIVLCLCADTVRGVKAEDTLELYTLWLEQAVSAGHASTPLSHTPENMTVISTRAIELFFSGHNMFNNSQFTSQIFPTPGRWFEGGLKMRFRCDFRSSS